MSILQAQSQVYNFSPAQMTKLIAADLEVEESRIKVEFEVSDTGDERYGSHYYQCTNIKVTVK